MQTLLLVVALFSAQTGFASSPKHLVGKPVIVLLKDGKTARGQLVSVDKETVRIAQAQLWRTLRRSIVEDVILDATAFAPLRGEARVSAPTRLNGRPSGRQVRLGKALSPTALIVPGLPQLVMGKTGLGVGLAIVGVAGYAAAGVTLGVMASENGRLGSEYKPGYTGGVAGGFGVAALAATISIIDALATGEPRREMGSVSLMEGPQGLRVRF